MTIRKLWLLVLVSIAIISIGINAFVLSSLTDRYFTDYLEASYKNHISQVLAYTKTTLLEENVSYKQMAIELETHLGESLTQIKLYGPDGTLLVDVDDNFSLTGGMMDHEKMFGMRNKGQVVVDQYPIENDGVALGVINITRTSSAENSFVSKMFKVSLVRNSILSIVIAIFISIIIGYFISKKMSLALKETADLAKDIQMGEIRIPKPTNIKEVISIRESLDHLNSRLKLKQKSRKALIDQLIHQSRTPLTVLKSHLEAMEDGLIDMNTKEIAICQDQIDNIESIISNMSGMIDANKETDELSTDEFDFQPLISQIKEGLKAQFEKKNILFELITHEKVKIETDKYKLSQAIYNILTNAYKYTNPGGNVRISYIVNEGDLFLKIQDTGIGINKEDLDRIFTAYYRGDGVAATKGEGIGLYIAKENIERLNGTISVTSNKDTGSTFVIKVPLSSPL